MRRRQFITLLGGAAATWPLAARAQQPEMPVVGVLSNGTAREDTPVLEALRAGLAAGGYEVGRNVTIEYRFGSGRQLPPLAADLVNRRVAVIVAAGALAPILAARAATSTIPIVFRYAGDPVADGLVASLSRPGGNVTGVTSIGGELASKRLDLLHKMVPQATTVGFLSGTPNYITYQEQTTSMLTAARALGLQLAIVECRSDQDFEAAFSTLDERRAEALILGQFPLGNLDKVVVLAGRHKIPAMYAARRFVTNGGLMSYAANLVAAARQVGTQYVAPILNRAKAADLPVQQPTKFELVINLRTARALGLEVPSTMLTLADEVIE
jgi:putative ABC transport system substrate-binding protein